MGLRLFLLLSSAPPIHIIWLTMEVGGSLLPHTVSSLAFHDTELLTSGAALLATELGPCSVLVGTKAFYCQFDNIKQGLYKVTGPWGLPLSKRLSHPLEKTSWGWWNSSMGKGVVMKGWRRSLVPSAKCKMSCEVANLCNSSYGKADRTGFLGLAGHPAWCTCSHACMLRNTHKRAWWEDFVPSYHAPLPRDDTVFLHSGVLSIQVATWEVENEATTNSKPSRLRWWTASSHNCKTWVSVLYK